MVSGLLLTPGASAGRDQPALVAIDEAATTAGLLVERIDFPYVIAGRRRPDPPATLIATVVEATEALALRLGQASSAVVIGGRSMGGRMCSMAAAAGLEVAGLVLVSYPLHPPGRPERLRVEHLGAIEVPCLFVSGTRDAFGSPEELERETAVIKGPVTRVWVAGGDHSLRGRDSAVAEAVVSWLDSNPHCPV
jgi:predicted alpha/beta-hydrolase family hydrolase